MIQRTFVFIKPLGMDPRFGSQILYMLTERSGDAVWSKHVNPTREHMEAHYAEHRGKSFFEDLVGYHTDKLVLALVFQGEDIVKKVRDLCGATFPKDAAPGTIRALAAEYAPDKASWEALRARGLPGDNLIHSSDSPESAEREINLWIPPAP